MYRSAVMRPADISLPLILNERNVCVCLFTLLHDNPPRQNGMERFMTRQYLNRCKKKDNYISSHIEKKRAIFVRLLNVPLVLLCYV